MGRGTGVELRARSMRLTFVEGKPTLLINGVPALPTAANIKWAHRIAGEIREKIKYGTFIRSEYFPVNGTAGDAAPSGPGDPRGKSLSSNE